MGAGVFVGGVLGLGAVCSSNVLAARHQRKCHPAPLVVATDLEPDDCLALLMLRLRGITPKAVMVGEGCAPLKVKRMQMLAPMLGWHNTRIVQGMSSATSALEYVEEGTCGDAAGCTTAGGDAAVCTAPVSWVAFLADLLDTGPDFREDDSTWEGWLAHKTAVQHCQAVAGREAVWKRKDSVLPGQDSGGLSRGQTSQHVVQQWQTKPMTRNQFAARLMGPSGYRH